ncbi:MAG: polysaccharide biosynthesis/export family protein, partial [Thermodesulfobacteriota bacterium]
GINRPQECRGYTMERRVITSIAALLLCLTLCGPDSLAAAADKNSASAKDSAATSVLGYLIGPEDVVEISVWKNPDMSKVVTVRPDGMISLPLIGDVKAANRTPNQLREAIIEKLSEYQDGAVVSVILQEINSYKIFILGSVAAPGSHIIKRRTSLLQAIALAGGFTQYASKNKIVVIRERASGQKNEKKIKVSFDDAVDVRKDSSDNLVLMPGDTIFVP